MKLKYHCLINDEKIIIIFIHKDMFMLLIGNFDIENKTNKFILRYLLKYHDSYSLESHFNFLKSNNFI